MKKNVAVIGCGTIAKAAHIPAYMKNPEATVAYFCDIIPERAQAMVEQYRCGKAVTDYHDILEDPEVVAVSICTPNNWHQKMAEDFLKAGKHVLSEKPAARTYEEALSMQRVQHETGKVLNIGVVNRFNDDVNRVKGLIDRGELGDIYHVYASFRSHRSIPGLGGDFTTKAISGGGVLIDWGVHFIDLILYCCNDPQIRSVTGQAYCKLGKAMEGYAYEDMWAGPPDYSGTYDVDDFVTGMIRTADATITLNGAWAQNIGEDEMYVDFLGDKGGVRLQYQEGFKLYTFARGDLMEVSSTYRKEDPYQREIDQFLCCIETGEKLPSHIDNVIQSSMIMQAIYDSSEQRREIQFDGNGTGCRA